MKIYKFNENKDLDPFDEEDWDENDYDTYDMLLTDNGYKKYSVNAMVSKADELYQKKFEGYYLDIYIWKEKTYGNGDVVPMGYEFQLYFEIDDDDIIKTIVHKRQLNKNILNNVELFMYETVERLRNFDWI